MSLQIVLMLSTLLILPLVAGVLTLQQIRHDRRTPVRVHRAPLNVPE